MTPKKLPDHPPTLEDSRDALLMPPSPPQPGTIRLLIAAGCTWTSREVPGATQLDITLMPPSTHHVKGGPRSGHEDLAPLDLGPATRRSGAYLDGTFTAPARAW